MAKIGAFFSKLGKKKPVSVEEEQKEQATQETQTSQDYKLAPDLDFEEQTFQELGEEVSDELENYDEFYFDDEFDMNSIPLFDLDSYREIFMQLRKQIDDLYDNHNNTTEEHETLAQLFKDIKASAYNDVVAEDFLGYCYKRGKYSFVPLNYENYMDITLLAAAKGNPFSIQRLQLFMTTTINDFYEVEGHEEIISELNITEENYTLFLTKIICDNMVKILNISVREILSRDGIMQEQTDSLTRKYEKARAEALKISIEELKDSAQELVDFYTVLINACEEVKNKDNQEETEEENFNTTENDETIQKITMEDEILPSSDAQEIIEVKQEEIIEEKTPVIETVKTQIKSKPSTTKKKTSTPKGSEELQKKKKS